MAKKTDKTANIDPDVTVIGKGSPYVTKSKPYKIKKASCMGMPFKKVIIEGDVESILENAFENCKSLTSVEIQDGVKEIGESAFEGCTSLISVVIPESVTEIGYTAFKGCTNLISKRFLRG